MGIDKSTDETAQDEKDQQAEAAAFEASFEGTSVAADQPESTDKAAGQSGTETDPAAEPAASQEPAKAAATSEPAGAAPKAPSPKADEPDMKLEIRKLNGRIGALNDQLQQALKTKETEGKPAVLSTVQLKRLKDEYPEMASMLEGDIGEVIENLAKKSVDPKEIQRMVSAQLEEEKFVMRQEAITDRHENWATDCWADEIGGQRTPEYQAWLNTMTKDEANAFENSQNPAFVIRKLDQFYDWKTKAAQAAQAKTTAEAEKQNRLKAAVAPTGTARAGPQTLSDEELERKAFEESFNS